MRSDGESSWSGNVYNTCMMYQARNIVRGIAGLNERDGH